MCGQLTAVCRLRQLQGKQENWGLIAAFLSDHPIIIFYYLIIDPIFQFDLRFLDILQRQKQALI